MMAKLSVSARPSSSSSAGVSRADSGEGFAFRLGQHVDAAQPVGFAQPFEGDDRSERAAMRHTVEEHRFHGYFLSIANRARIDGAASPKPMQYLITGKYRL
jgi:hypothetical protein